MDNISLESMSHWLSDDIVRFNIEVAVEEKCTKNVTPFPMFWLRRSSKLLSEARL